MEALHPMPACKVDNSGYEKCPNDAYSRDPELERATAGSAMGALIRLVGGYLKRKPNWSRTRMAMHSTPGGWVEIGWAHMSRGNAARVFSDIATQLPEVASYAWGEEASRMRDPGYVESIIRQAKGTGKMPSDLDWLVAGWHQISRRGDVQRVYLRRWFDQFVAPVQQWMEKNGFKHGTTLAAGVRMNSTAPAWFDHLRSRVSDLGEGPGTLKALSEYGKWSTPAMKSKRDRTDRVKTIYGSPEFQTQNIGRADPDQISWLPEGALPILKDPGGIVPTSSGAPASALGSGLARMLRANWKTAALAMLAGGGVAAAYFLWFKSRKKKKKGGRR